MNIGELFSPLSVMRMMEHEVNSGIVDNRVFDYKLPTELVMDFEKFTKLESHHECVEDN